MNRICRKVTTAKSFSTKVNKKIKWSKWSNSMCWNAIPEICQNLPLLLLLQEKDNILFRLREIKLLHGSELDSDVVICKDADVLILMIWAYSKLNINNWYLIYDHEKLAEIRKKYFYFGKILPLNLPKIQALTGCNTISYF